MRRRVKSYLAEVFEPTLLLAFLTSLVGIAAATRYGPISYPLTGLVIVGSVFAQMSVNLLNDYDDYAIGIDRVSKKTKYSGGSSLVASGAVKHLHVLYLGLLAALIAGMIGIYLALTVSLLLLVFMAIGSVCIFMYTRYVVRFPFMAELFVMLAFSLVAVGSFVVAHGSFLQINYALFAILPAGILSGLVLLVNEMPDAVVDRRFGRRHAVIILNSNRKVSAYFIAWLGLTYAIIIAGILNSVLNPFFIMVFATLPMANYVAVGIMNYKNPQNFEKYMASNVLNTFIYLVLLTVAYSL